MQNTIDQYNQVLEACCNLFREKLVDYGAAWRVLRPGSVTDQIYIKINRIRTLQLATTKMIDEDETEDFIAIVNYSIIGLIQLGKGVSRNFRCKNTEEILTL